MKLPPRQSGHRISNRIFNKPETMTMTDTPETDQAERESIAAYIDADGPIIYGASLVIPTNPSWANSPIHQEVQEWERESIHSQYVNRPSETLVAERDRLDYQLDQTILRLGETQERMIDAERQRDRLAEALNAILNDDPDSPLYKIKEARAALAAWKEARCES
jgi:hypothetical protein